MGPDLTRRVQSNQGEDDGGVVDSVGAVKVDVDGVASAAAAERSQSSKWPSAVDATAKRGDAAIRGRREESFIVACVDVERERVARRVRRHATPREGCLFVPPPRNLFGPEIPKPNTKY